MCGHVTVIKLIPKLKTTAAVSQWQEIMAKTIGAKFRAHFQQTMLRIKDPAVSVPFYEKHFGMQLIHKYDFPQWKFSVYFMERRRDDAAKLPEPGTKASEEYLWKMQGTTLELTHNHGSESDDEFKVWSGNHGGDLPDSSPLYMKDGPTRGFGHVAFNVPDVTSSLSRTPDPTRAAC